MSVTDYHDMDQQFDAANNPLASWQSYASSMQHDDYAEFGLPLRMIGAGLGYIDTPREPQHCLPTSIEAGYLCLHPGCKLIFGDDLALEDHMKTHFDQPKLPAASAAVGHAATRVHQPLLASDRVDWGERKCPIEGCRYTCKSYICTNDVEYHRRTHFLRGDKYMCQTENCGCDFKRWGDLLRHEKKHLPDAPKLDCPEIGCEYKGSRGFARRDKLMDHRRNRHGLAAAPRTHRRNVQKSAVGSFTATEST